MPSVNVSIVTWNSAQYIDALLNDLQKQTLLPNKVVVVDNGSVDDSVARVRSHSGVNCIELGKNTGFSHGHNLGINSGTSEYILVVNPDVRIASTYLAELVNFAEQHPNVGSFVGVIRRPDGSVDTAGLQVKRTRVVREITQEPEQPTPLFGVSGAVALYRRSALQQVMVEGQVFDEALFAYKEDVQLAWRLQWAGWEAYCVPTAHAQHIRVVQTATRRSQRDVRRRFLSYRNHLLLYATVEQCRTFWPDALIIFSAEVGRFGYLLCTDACTTLRALAAACKMWHAARTFATRELRRISDATIRARLTL